MIKAWLGSGFDARIRRFFPYLFSLSPNVLTLAGAGISLLGAVLLGRGAFGAAFILVFAGGLCDMLDGAVAREKGLATPFGAFLDSTVDRLVDMGLFLGLIVYYASAGDLSGILLASWAMVGSVLVSYAKARAEAFIPSLAGGLIERGERILILALGILLQALLPASSGLRFALWVIAVGSMLTLGQRVYRAYCDL